VSSESRDESAESSHSASRDVICLSSQPWGDAFWTNKQHIMSRLADRGWRILYVDPPSNERLTLRRFREMSSLEEARPNLWVCRPYPLRKRAYPSLSRCDGLIVRRIARRLQLVDPLLWVYHPATGAAVNAFPGQPVLYDCVDDYASFPQFASVVDIVRSHETALLERADVVTCTSKSLFEAKSTVNPNTHLVENVADYTHFRQTDEATPDPGIMGLSRPRIGFVGAVSSHKLDADLIVETARTRSDWTFVFVGGEMGGQEVIDRCAGLENVKFLGHRPYDELPSVMAAVDVLWIPYASNLHVAHIFPIKFFEYLASGKPVVVTPIPALERHLGLVETGTNAEELVEALGRAMSNDDAEKRGRRLAVAAQNTWDDRIDRIIERLPPPRA
jgi:glycosyltransferase involved in cell wall biosynthesis